jgi:hypothetical protein
VVILWHSFVTAYVVDWIGLAQDRYRLRALVNAVMNLPVPYNAGKLPSGCTTCGLSSGTQLHRVNHRVTAYVILEDKYYRVPMGLDNCVKYMTIGSGNSKLACKKYKP